MRFSEETLTHLDINLGDQCNLKCRMCECWLNSDPLQLEADTLWPRVEESLRYVERNCPNFDKAMIIGGEPFTHPGLLDFLLEQDLETTITVYTNFSIELPDVEWPDNVYFLTSLDASCEETYQKIRRTDDWETTQRNMERHSDRLLHVDTTVSKLNVDEMADIMEVTEGFDCTHWFLPVDPRIVEYSRKYPDNDLAESTAVSMVPNLLDEEAVATAIEFYEAHGDNPRINNEEMFLNLYYQSVQIYDHITEWDVEMPDIVDIERPEGKCPAGERYLEIGFDDDGRFVPIVHCPELREYFRNSDDVEITEPDGERRMSSFQPYKGDMSPHFEDFGELVDWMSGQFTCVECSQHCGKSQFLGVDDFTSMLGNEKEVKKQLRSH